MKDKLGWKIMTKFASEDKKNKRYKNKRYQKKS